jgi:hypothetical protein
MRFVSVLFAALLIGWALVCGSSINSLPDLNIGKGLQTSSYLTLAEPAPDTGMTVTITSADPSRLLIAKDMASPGEPSIALSVKLILHSVRLEATGEVAEPQQIAGGMHPRVEIELSDPDIGSVEPAVVDFAGGTATYALEFKPKAVGTTDISIQVPPGFTRLSTNQSLKAMVQAPGLALTTEIMIGQNLQVRGIVGLGAPAPPKGVKVEVESIDPSKLLLARSATEVGKPKVVVEIPEGGANSEVYLQALASSGTVTYRATADGYQERTATVTLTPSGVVLMSRPYGPPDEAELHGNHKISPTSELYTKLGKGKLPLVVWTVQLDPATMRAADVTVQPLRAGMTLDVALGNSNPAVGKIKSPIRIQPGMEMEATEFEPLTAGSAVLSVQTPPGFSTPANSTTLKAVVQ